MLNNITVIERHTCEKHYFTAGERSRLEDRPDYICGKSENGQGAEFVCIVADAK